APWQAKRVFSTAARGRRCSTWRTWRLRIRWLASAPSASPISSCVSWCPLQRIPRLRHRRRRSPLRIDGPPLSTGFDMTIIYNALSGALAAQAALSATSQNVANVMTPGYTRQGVLLASVQPLQSGAVSAGSGVKVASLLRFSDNYKTLQLWSAASELGRREAVLPYFTQLEQVFGEDETGINAGLDAFFSALNAASVEPTSAPLRQQVITTADALAQRFNSLNQVLSNQRSSVAQQRLAAISHINSLARQIAELNREIARTQGTGVN